MAIDPVTREEQLLNAVATGKATNIEPITREEMFLAKAAGMSVNTPEPVTRKEMFLNEISGGGGNTNPSAKWNDVTFIDYDGTVLYSYSLEEAKALTELPELPSHDGLICQGWNYELETIKSYDRPVTIGATYITDDGKTRIYIHLENGRTSPMLGVCPNGTVTVDWGDGTEPDILTGTSAIQVKWTPTHEYAKPGDYVISLTVDGEMSICGGTSSPSLSSILRYSDNEYDRKNLIYLNAVTKIEIGNGSTSIDQAAFCGCCSLTNVVIADGVTSIGYQAFDGCNSILCVVIPSSVTEINSYAFNSCSSLKNVVFPAVPALNYFVWSEHSFANCYSLKNIIIPDNVKIIPYGAFEYCSLLSNIVIPDGVSSIAMGAFQNCDSLVNVVISDSVDTIEWVAFAYCSNVRYYDFTACTSVPVLSGSSAFDGIPEDCEMLIPAALYDEWSTATNWATYASYMVAV